jgi:hypothetical protein
VLTSDLCSYIKSSCLASSKVRQLWPTSLSLSRCVLFWVTCPYYQLDGQFNPDVRTVNNIGAFDTMANAILYNALAWTISGSSL